MYDYALIACARWEDAHIAEWIEYHQSIGFQHFYIYSNDDDYYQLASALMPYIKQKIVTYTYCPDLGGQHAMYGHFQQKYLQQCNWISFLDIDEFYSLPGYDNKIDNMVKDINQPSIVLNWKMFGTNGYKVRPAGSVLLQYTLRKIELDINVKNITHRSVAEKPLAWASNHAWPLQITHSVNVLGENDISAKWIYESADISPFLEYLKENNQRICNVATVHHYFMKSEADFQRRLDRCNIGHFSNQNGYKDFVNNLEMKQAHIAEHNQISDCYLKDYWKSYITSHLLPNNFDAAAFTQINPDLIKSDTSADETYIRTGNWLNRQYILPNII